MLISVHLKTKYCGKCQKRRKLKFFSIDRRIRGDGYQNWCKDCVNKFTKRYYRTNIREIKYSTWKRERLIKKEVADAYGGKCACCGESNLGFLTIDHIFNDGNIERKSIIENGGPLVVGTKLYRRLKKMGYPKDRYQLLCWNCNCGKRMNGGICPHKYAFMNESRFERLIDETNVH